MDNDLKDFELYKDGEEPKTERLESLRPERGNTTDNINKGYSRFIRKVQFALPVMALLLLAIIFNWNRFESDKIVPIKQQDIKPEIRQEISQNELINPNFESIDEKGQPFKLKADKATQDSTNENDEMLLENPSGSMQLNSGEELTIRSKNGAYSKIKQRLNLTNDVVLSHSAGYELKTEIMHVDLAKNIAWSQETVNVTGPEGTITSSGVEASSPNETVIFKGPAKMLLTFDNAHAFGDLLP